MSLVKIVPFLMISESIIAAFVYLMHNDVRMFVYWTAAAVLTTAIAM